MERKKFLKTLGASAAFAVAFPCLHACSSDAEEELETFPVPDGVDFTVDLTAAEAAPLANNGGFILKNFVVIARNLEGNLVAASQVCSHQQTEEVRFISEDGGIFRCSTHGSRFSQNGTPLNTITNNPLKIFNTELNGDVLRVFE
ncbi:ubiquinol-cytochrome c reductase iron-sulfur subunit [Croceitalea rosinachiae]|uniref:Rieske 2Fe-2S domain-containing protein n=1 Tax=Croceitalea rosinachiae TaxID=3075596 RepID=A0ABU3ADA8_9FLAO|nr:Rieske 2Fe-2S domain-containing protein [Croceitalea sp. F388]MDT0608170.1 Rieske 2Fe-2S domain-containing protein [Croceitalea sp. F388]